MCEFADIQGRFAARCLGSGLSGYDNVAVDPAVVHHSAMVDIYESAVEEAGQFGAVFERDEETAFFYLLDLHQRDGSQIVGAFSADVVNDLPADVPVTVEWNASGNAAGLYVSGNLVALFDLRSEDLRGRYAEEADHGLFRPH